MILDPKQVNDKDIYKLLIGLVVPRPIAFVTTMTDAGIVNAAPFSFFNVVCTNPPMLAVSVARKPDGSSKDTSANIQYNRQFVVHVAEERMISQVNHASCPYPPDISEVEKAGLRTLPSHKIKVPRIRECRVAMECILHKLVELGNGPDTDLIIGEVVQFHVDDKLLQDGKIKIAELNPVARLAGSDYSKLGEMFSLERPVYEQ